MGGVFTHRLGATGLIAVPEPNYYRTAILADATGQANGTGYAADESRHAHALTYNGNAAILSEKFEFDGTGDWIDFSMRALFTPGSKFTMELFGLEFDAINTGTNQGIATQYSADIGNVGWHLYESGGDLIFRWSTDGATSGAGEIVALGSVAIATNYDVAVCWNGQSIYALVNGVQTDSIAFTGTFFNPGAPVRFGCLADNNVEDRFLNGRFSAFVFTKGEVLYESTGTHAVPSLPRALDMPSLTDSLWADVVLLVGYDASISRIRDFGPFDLPLTVAGNAAGDLGVTLGDGTPSIALDGTGDYVQTPDEPLLELGAGAHTIETFARHTVNTADHTYVSHYDTTTQRSYAFIYRGASATDILELLRSSNGTGTTSPVQSAAWTPTVDVFYHVAESGDGTNHRLFVDGTQTGTTNTTAVSLFDGTGPTRIGTINSSGLTLYMNGYLTQIRITKANRYPSNFTAPTGVLPVG